MVPTVTDGRRSRRLGRQVLRTAAWCLLGPLAGLAWPAASGAQLLPSEPVQLAGGRLVVAGEVAAGVSTSRDRGFFNYTDYTHNALRLLRIAASAEWRIRERLAVLGEVRTENGDRLRPYALFVRLRPVATRPVDVQVGRIPPVFGSFARRNYGASNPLIGYPLAYQYLTSLRADALPASADDLLRMRGRGWLTRYPLGNPKPAPGLPLATAFRWDTGVQARAAGRRIELAGALSRGSLSNPLVRDDNGGKQIAGRLAARPAFGLVVGVSVSRGAYLSRRATDSLPAELARRTAQTAVGLDVEYARGHWLLRGEVLTSAWQVPTPQAPRLAAAVRARAAMAEGRYTVRPGWYVAARADRLAFSRVSGSLFEGRPVPWDAPVGRLEVASGWYLQRNLVLKFGYQHNWRDGGYVRASGFGATQVVYWF
jgi:hypothetical protein